MGGGEPARDAQADLGGAPRLERKRQPVQAPAAYPLLRDVRLAAARRRRPEDGDHVRVVEPGDGARLGEEAQPRGLVGGARADQLDGDEPVEDRVVAEEHLAHAAVPEGADQAELVEVSARACCGRGGRRRRGEIARRRHHPAQSSGVIR